jgi:glycosyltransferase involved in cell wall biosynthesis
MKTILLSAYACDPSKGSEDGNGYHWANGLTKEGFSVVCVTQSKGKSAIEKLPNNSYLTFIFVDLPLGLGFLYSFSRPTMYLHYILWQWFAYQKAKKLSKQMQFDLVHHVTWGSLQLGSFMYKLKLPFIFGPVGGGQVAPVAFKKYFKSYWDVEVKRELTSKLLLKLNPGCNRMLRTAKEVIVSNLDTKNLAINNGATKCSLLFDAQLPENFFPKILPIREKSNVLKLLWIGRLLPRKGILLVTEVLEAIKMFSDITLTIVGDGEMRGYLEKDIEKRGLSNVNYLGAVPYEKVKEFYASHDVFFFTSLRDSGGSQLFEAMAYGLPIVTLKLHGQDAIVNDAVGIKCNVIDPNETVIELKNAILSLYNNRELLQVMSENAFEYAKKQTWKNQIKHVVENYY